MNGNSAKQRKKHGDQDKSTYRSGKSDKSLSPRRKKLMESKWWKERQKMKTVKELRKLDKFERCLKLEKLKKLEELEKYDE